MPFVPISTSPVRVNQDFSYCSSRTARQPEARASPADPKSKLRRPHTSRPLPRIRPGQYHRAQSEELTSRGPASTAALRCSERIAQFPDVSASHLLVSIVVPSLFRTSTRRVRQIVRRGDPSERRVSCQTERQPGLQEDRKQPSRQMCAGHSRIPCAGPIREPVAPGARPQTARCELSVRRRASTIGRAPTQSALWRTASASVPASIIRTSSS